MNQEGYKVRFSGPFKYGELKTVCQNVEEYSRKKEKEIEDGNLDDVVNNVIWLIN